MWTLPVAARRCCAGGVCDKRAVEAMLAIEEKGLQVEWLEFSSFMAWMLYLESAAVQTIVQVMPHVIDTALMYITYLRIALRLHVLLVWGGPASAPGQRSFAICSNVCHTSAQVRSSCAGLVDPAPAQDENSCPGWSWFW